MIRHFVIARRSIIAPVVALLLLVVAWEAGVEVFGIPRYLLPPPSALAETLVKDAGFFVPYATATLVATVGGFMLAMVFGILLAVVMVWSRTIEDATYPLIVLTQVMPKIAIAPLLVIYLGFGTAPKIFLAFLVSFFPVVINTTLGLKSVSVELLELLATFRASKWQVLVKVRLWRAIPFIVEGAKIAITLAVIGAIIGEFQAGNDGLGYLIISAASNLDTTLGFSALIILIAIGIVLFEAIDIVGKLLMPWAPKSSLEER